MSSSSSSGSGSGSGSSSGGSTEISVSVNVESRYGSGAGYDSTGAGNVDKTGRYREEFTTICDCSNANYRSFKVGALLGAW